MIRRSRLDVVPTHGAFPVFTFGGLIVATGRARRFRDDAPVTEWLGGEPQTTIRARTEQWVPVPFTATDWDALVVMLGGDA